MQLIEELKSLDPQPVVISNFPGNPWIAKFTARVVPGWSPDHLIVDQPAKGRAAIELRWDSERQVYQK